MTPAVDRFRALLAAQPGNPLHRFSLGKALHDAGAWSEAATHLRACADGRADWMLPRILLGKCLAAAGDTAGARSAWSEALALAEAQDHDDPAAELRSLLAALG